MRYLRRQPFWRLAMEFPRGAGIGPRRNTANRSLPIRTAISVLLIGTAAAAAQPAPPASDAPSFPDRVEAVARALQNNPRLKNLTDQQRLDRVNFVVGNTLFVLLHEIGHVHVSDMNLPVLGREEDAADAFAALTMLKLGTSFSHRVLTEASKGWFLSDRRDQQTGAAPLYYDEHSLSQQRAYQVVCLMVGSDPVKFKDLAKETKLPESRQESCKDDYVIASRSWDKVLDQHRRTSEQPETRIEVAYSDAKGDLDVFARSFRAVHILEAVAQRSAATYRWPEPFALKMESCGRAGASWDDKTRILKMCYELAFDFAELYRAYVPTATAPTRPPVRTSQKRKLK
jgi:putative metallopeptidase DUF4344